MQRHGDAVTVWLLLAAAGGLGIAALWRWDRGRRRAQTLMRFAAAVAEETDLPPLPPALRGSFGDWQQSLTEISAAQGERLRSVRTEERRLQAVLGGMVEGVLVIDGAGTVVLINRRAEQILDLAPGRYSGRSLIELTRHPDLHELVQWVMSEGGLARPSAREIALDGSRQQVLRVTATPLSVTTDGGRAYILVFHDISELKRLERIRRDFVANVSHELRTPLAAIRGYTETLLGGALDDAERARRFLGIIERHTDRLGRLVDDLLTLSDLELGRTALRRTPVAAASIAEATFEVLRHKAVSAGIALEQDIAPGTPKLNADEDRLEQAILNLVDNAIKYTPQGGRVTLSARAGAGGSGPGRSVGRRAGALRRAGGDGHRGGRSARGPAAPDRALLPRRQGALARARRHRAGSGDRQAHRAGARGLDAHREPGQPRHQRAPVHPRLRRSGRSRLV